MKTTQTQQTHLHEVLTIINDLGGPAEALDSIQVSRSGERWGLLLSGVQGVPMNGLLRHFNARHEPEGDTVNGEWALAQYVGHRGRVVVRFYVFTHLVTRINGRTPGQSPALEALDGL